jgi:fructosamine-3-kinase
MKTIKKIVNDRNKILIYENKNKKYVDKIFNSKNLFFFKKEKLGIKYFKKNKIFDIPKVYSYKIKNNIGIITSEYIEGKKTHVRKINQVYKSGPFISKKVNFNKYLGDLNNNYKIKKKNLT